MTVCSVRPPKACFHLYGLIGMSKECSRFDRIKQLLCNSHFHKPIKAGASLSHVYPLQNLKFTLGCLKLSHNTILPANNLTQLVNIIYQNCMSYQSKLINETKSLYSVQNKFCLYFSKIIYYKTCLHTCTKNLRTGVNFILPVNLLTS